MVRFASHDQNRQVCLLQYQMQQYLNQLRPSCFAVRTDDSVASSVALSDGVSEFKPAISVLESKSAETEAVVRWVISTVYTDSSIADNRLLNQQQHLCARLAIADYWLLTPLQSELRTYSMPNTLSYQQQQLCHVGERVSPSSIPEITLCIQEPLPLYFLTRTLKGQRTYESSALPLQVC